MSIRREISNSDMHGTIRLPQLLGQTLDGYLNNGRQCLMYIWRIILQLKLQRIVAIVGVMTMNKVFNPNLMWLITQVHFSKLSLYCRYTVSLEPFVWKDLQNQLTTTKLLHCESKNKDNVEPFFMKVSRIGLDEFCS